MPSNRGDGTILAFDHGGRRIGVAVGQTLTASARPLSTLGARDGVPRWEEVAALIDEWSPVRLVVGEPRRLDGADSEAARRARKFANRLHGRFGLPVSLVAEQLSSAAAEQRLGGRRAREDKAAVDREAATVILEHYFMETQADDLDAGR